MSEYPTMTGWRKRERAAKERAERKQRMAEIRAARKRARIGQEADARGEAAEHEPTESPVSRREGDSPTVPPDYPNPDDMDRDALFAYLKAHGVNPGPASKDETLRAKVREVRDGDAE